MAQRARTRPELIADVHGDAMLKGTAQLALVGLGLALLIVGLTIAAIFANAAIVDDALEAAEMKRAEIALEAALGKGDVPGPELAARLAHEAQLGGARFADAAAAGPDEIVLAVPDSAVALLWTPNRLGRDLLMDRLPERLLLAALFVAVVALVMYRLYFTAVDLNVQRRAARYAADRDALTGLASRLAFEDRLVRDFASRNGPLALFYLDLDEFKAVNDRHGHAVGDAVLRVVGERLLGMMRPGDLVTRLGGDEFAILCPAGRNREELAAHADMLHWRIAEPLRVAGIDVAIGVSIGIALAPEDAADPDRLMLKADRALYAAKADGIAVAFAGDLTTRNAAA